LNAPGTGKLWALRLLTGALLAAALLIAVVGLVAQARRRPQLEEASRQAADLLAAAQDLLARHPDYPFADAERQLAAYRELPPRRRAGALDAIRRLYLELERSAVSRATGREPGGERWPELLSYKTYSPNGFRALYESLAVAAPGPAPTITGQAEADERIARLALARGYRLRAEADPARLADAGGGRRLEAAALEAFRRLEAEAAAQGRSLQLVSGFRTVARQRTIFLEALAGQGRERAGRAFTAGEIAAGAADEALDATLAASAPPGFSRHHTGFALDLNDPSTGRPFTEFGESAAYRWLAADNYLIAKRFGFIPSYPPGAGAQGPDPEPWEFVWVGEAVLASPAPH
jgi:LAS superfamily LD-carboxypeptidase LdcB